MHVNIDPNFVDNMVNEVKSQGVFDAFRRDSMADVDTKPAYQNLKQRVENSVTKFLSDQKWTPELNKNQMREKLRKHIIEAGFLDVGVQRIVDQVVNPKISTVFQPRIEDIVYKYLGIDKPELKAEPKNEAFSLHESLTISTDLLPTDLEAVSPDSDKSGAKFDTHLERKYEIQEEHDEEDDESPPFEPLEGPSPSKVKEEDINTYSRLSGISGLTSQSEMPDDTKNVKEEDKTDLKEEVGKNELQMNSVGEFAQESQLSQVSSNSRLSIVSNDDERNQKDGTYIQESSANVDISEEAQMPKFNENSNSYQPPSGEILHFDIKKDEIKFEGTDRNNEILPPVYQSEMLERTDEKNRSDISRQINITQPVEEISNGTVNTESQNSTYFDDDSERGVLQIIEDPTQDFSREQSRPPSAMFQKPEIKDEKNIPDENVQANKQDSDASESSEKKSDITENKLNAIAKTNYNDEKSEHYSQNKVEPNEKPSKYEDKVKLSGSSSSNRHSASSSSHKSHRSKDKRSDREKDKGRKSSSSDSKLSSDNLSISYQIKNQSSSRHSTSLSSHLLKEGKEIKTNGSTHYKCTGSSKYASSISTQSKNEKRKSSERDRKRDYDRSRDDKSSKSEKQKPHDDHSCEKNKRNHRKSTDSNDGDRKGYSNSKGQKNSKNITAKTCEETKNDHNELINQQNSTCTSEGNDGEVQRKIMSSPSKQMESLVKETSKFNMSNPIMIDNLNMANMEFIIGSNTTQNQKGSIVESITNEPNNQANSQNNETSNDLGKNENTVELNNATISNPLLQKITKTDIILPINKKSNERNRFETLISPPPKKRKYDMSFNNLVQNCNTNVYIPNIKSTGDDGEINLFGFDIQEEQDNYHNVMKDYEGFYKKFFEWSCKLGDQKSIEIKYKLKFNKMGNNYHSQIETKCYKNTVDSIENIEDSTDNNRMLELCHTSITNEEFKLSGKSLTINCYDYDIVPNNSKKKTKALAVSSTEILNSKISPSLSDSSIGSKENEFSEKNNCKKIKGGEKKTNLQTLLTSQRYTCDDLYKPRLSLSQRSRRRALDNEIR